MASIKSENRRRQRIFTEYGVNNINSYTSLFKSGDAAEPIPHLFIIIDEFAELKREEPDFMKEYRSGIRFGGRMSDQSVFAFDNVKYQDQDKTMKPGIGIIPSDDKQARLEKLIIPMYRG